MDGWPLKDQELPLCVAKYPFDWMCNSVVKWWWCKMMQEDVLDRMNARDQITIANTGHSIKHLNAPLISCQHLRWATRRKHVHWFAAWHPWRWYTLTTFLTWWSSVATARKRRHDVNKQYQVLWCSQYRFSRQQEPTIHGPRRSSDLFGNCKSIFSANLHRCQHNKEAIHARFIGRKCRC